MVLNGNKRKIFVIAPIGFNQLVIDEAFSNGDKQTVIDAYFDVLDY